jgi:hypothetical protein
VLGKTSMRSKYKDHAKVGKIQESPRTQNTYKCKALACITLRAITRDATNLISLPIDAL